MADTSLIFNILAKDKTSGTFDKIKKGAAVAGAAIGAVLVAGVAMAIDKAKLDAKLAAQLGASPAQAREIGKLSGSVYAAGFGEDLPGVTAAIKSAAQNGLVPLDKISADTSKTVIKNMLTVGNVLEEDSDRVSSAIAQMLKTGMAKSSQEAMDLLITATQKGVNKSQDLLDTVNEYSTQFRKLGIDGTQSLGLLSQAIQAGARDSDTAADALKEFSIRSVDGSKLSAQGYKLLGMDAKKMTAQMARGGASAAGGLDAVLNKLRDMKDPVKQQAAAVDLFGTKAEDLGKSLFSMNLGTAADQMKGMDGATQKAAATATAGAASYGTMGRQLKMALVDTLNQALPAVNAVFGFMQKNSGWVKPLAVGLTVIAGAMAIATAVQWAYNAALAVNPVVWIVAAIVALIVIIVLVATKTRFFQATWGYVWGFMKAVGAWFAGPFAGFFVMVGKKIAAFAVGAWNMVKSYFGFWFGLYAKIAGGAVSMVKSIVDKFASFINFVKGLPGKIGHALGNMFAPLWNGFRTFVNKLISGWNGLHFGIPGFSFAGINVPGINIGTPDIPYLARGGHVRSEGMAYIHRGETVTPAAKVTPFRDGSSGGGGTLTIKGDGSRLANLLLETIRESIRDKGGDVVKVLTPR